MCVLSLGCGRVTKIVCVLLEDKHRKNSRQFSTRACNNALRRMRARSVDRSPVPAIAKRLSWCRHPASASEDNTVRVWRGDGTCLQTLEHPTCAWAVAFLPSGDLVSGCGDAVARVWSQVRSLSRGGIGPQRWLKECHLRVH